MRSLKIFFAVATLAALLAQDAGQAAASQPSSVSTAVLDAAIASGDELGLAQRTFDAVQKGQYAPAAILVVICLVWTFRKWGDKLPKIGPRIHRWVNTDRGGASFVFITAILGGLLHAVTAGGFHAITGSVIKMSLMLGVGAIGGFTGARKILFPGDKVDPKTPPPTPAT